jgi:hypothetical protein
MHGDTGGSADFSADGSTLTIMPTMTFPVGASLVVLIEPGMSDAAGAVTRVRRALVFGYATSGECNAPVHVVRSGTYFFLLVITKPVSVQLQLYGVVVLDPATGQLKAQLTKAARNPDGTRCTPACASTDVCRTLPGPPACVAPGTPATTVDEFPDYVPHPDPPTGYSFLAPGCAADESATTASFATSPVDVMVEMPMVTLRGASLSSQFVLGGDGTLRGMGSLAAEALVLGTVESGAVQGNLTAISLADQDVPPGLPQP